LQGTFIANDLYKTDTKKISQQASHAIVLHVRFVSYPLHHPSITDF
jgi:hypothetical protein